MNRIDEKRVSELVIDEWIWVVFIILSALNINGDELEKKYCYDHLEEEKNRAKKIFTFTVFVSFIIYAYLAVKNYRKYNTLKESNQDTRLASIRSFASILVVIASSLFLTAQLEDTKATNPSIQ